MNNIIDTNNSNKLEKYHLFQLENFKTLSNLFLKYILELDKKRWKEIVKELEPVLNKCDEIDYQSDATAIAYAIWHFLDRYHRIQIMCTFLLEEGYLNYAKQYDVLDVGTGPSQVLFALSDHFQCLNKIEKNILCTVNPDYVEQSKGFRQFMHHFVEYSLQNGKQYLVPFHFGRTEDALDISFSERYPYKNYKYRYDITVFNNFLTTKKFTEKCSDTLKNICKYTRNHGLVIVMGATEKSDKYKEIYNIIDGIINRKFKGRYYYGHWNKVFDREFNYKYEDQYGCVLGEYFKNIVNYLKENNLWESVSETAKKEFEINSSIPMSEEKLKDFKGATWKMVVYRKISRPNLKTVPKLAKRIIHRNDVRLLDDIWRRDIEISKDK